MKSELATRISLAILELSVFFLGWTNHIQTKSIGHLQEQIKILTNVQSGILEFIDPECWVEGQ